MGKGGNTGEVSRALSEAKRKPGRPPGTTGATSVTRRNVLAAQRMFQQFAEESMNVMVEIMRDPEAEPAVRLKAANDIQNRAFGTPVSVSVQHQIQERENVSPVSAVALTGAATKELEQLALTLARFVEQERNTLDVTPEMPDNYPRD